MEQSDPNLSSHCIQIAQQLVSSAVDLIGEFPSQTNCFNLDDELTFTTHVELIYDMLTCTPCVLSFFHLLFTKNISSHNNQCLRMHVCYCLFHFLHTALGKHSIFHGPKTCHNYMLMNLSIIIQTQCTRRHLWHFKSHLWQIEKEKSILNSSKVCYFRIRTISLVVEWCDDISEQFDLHLERK